MKMSISFMQGALGDEVMATTIEGKHVKLKIPAGTQTNSEFHLWRLGMPRLEGGLGDLYVEAIVQTPRNLTKR